MANPGPSITTTSNIIQESVPSDGHQFGSAATQALGFWGAAPVVQQGAAGNVHTVAAGSVTSAFVNTTFDGSVGSTAYTIGDIVLALKTIGILKT